MLDVFEHSDYRALLKDALIKKKGTDGRTYSQEAMARALRVQRTYLSAVLNENGHLNSDQVYAATKFLQFEIDKIQYTSLLHEKCRSVFPDRIAELQKQMEEIVRKYKATEKSVPGSILEENSIAADFYLDPYAPLIHMFLTVDRYRKNQDLICKCLGISKDVFHKSLKIIAATGLITMERGRVEKVKEDALHLPSGSSFQTLYRTNLRMQALVRLGQTQLDENYSFFALLTTNPQGRQKIQNEFFKFLKVAQQESQKYPSEEVYQMNFDILKWSHDLP